VHVRVQQTAVSIRFGNGGLRAYPCTHAPASRSSAPSQVVASEPGTQSLPALRWTATWNWPVLKTRMVMSP
jgi:hypothetical protein